MVRRPATAQRSRKEVLSLVFTRLPHEGARWATCNLSSLDRTNWASVLAYQLDCDPVADDVNLPALPDQMVRLVTAGSTTIESRAGGKWRRSVYGPGTVAMTKIGRASCRERVYSNV